MASVVVKIGAGGPIEVSILFEVVKSVISEFVVERKLELDIFVKRLELFWLSTRLNTQIKSKTLENLIILVPLKFVRFLI